MELTKRLLCIYEDCIRSKIDVQLNLWSRGGEEFFSFQRTQEKSSTQSRTRKRNHRRRKNNKSRAKDTETVAEAGSYRDVTAAGVGSYRDVAVAGACSYSDVAVAGACSYSDVAVAGAGSYRGVAAAGAGSPGASFPGADSPEAGSPGAGEGSLSVGPKTGTGSPSYRAGSPSAGAGSLSTGAVSPIVGAVGAGSRRPAAGFSSVGAVSAGSSSGKAVETGSPSVPPCRMKTRSLSRQTESNIPQLDGSCVSPPSHPSESPLRMFGYCAENNCSICPEKTPPKFGGYYACFMHTDKSKETCTKVHAHSRNSLCLTDADIINLNKL